MATADVLIERKIHSAWRGTREQHYEECKAAIAAEFRRRIYDSDSAWHSGLLNGLRLAFLSIPGATEEEWIALATLGQG